MDVPSIPKTLFEDSELLSQFENVYYSQCEELKFFKAKYNELQVELTKVCEEKRELELELMRAKNVTELVLRNAEIEKETLRFEYEAKFGSAKMETENFKQLAESVKKERELLFSQYQLLQSHKSEAVKRVTEMQAECVTVHQHKRAVHSFVQDQKDAIHQLLKRFDLITSSKDQLTVQLEDQEKQVKLFEKTIASFELQERMDKAKISELEKKYIELAEANEILEKTAASAAPSIVQLASVESTDFQNTQ